MQKSRGTSKARQTDARLNTSQRQALVKLVQNAYDRRIEAQRHAYSEAVARITREVKEELGVDKMEDAITEHERSMKALEAEKEKLGFSKYRNDGVIPGSEAKKLIDERATEEKQKVTSLHAELDALMSKIWTAIELSEVKAMVDEVLGVD